MVMTISKITLKRTCLWNLKVKNNKKKREREVSLSQWSQKKLPCSG